MIFSQRLMIFRILHQLMRMLLDHGVSFACNLTKYQFLLKPEKKFPLLRSFITVCAPLGDTSTIKINQQIPIDIIKNLFIKKSKTEIRISTKVIIVLFSACMPEKVLRLVKCISIETIQFQFNELRVS